MRKKVLTSLLVSACALSLINAVGAPTSVTNFCKVVLNSDSVCIGYTRVYFETNPTKICAHVAPPMAGTVLKNVSVATGSLIRRTFRAGKRDLK